MLSKREAELKLERMRELVAFTETRSLTSDEKREFDELDEALTTRRTVIKHQKHEGLRGGYSAPMTPEERAFDAYLRTGQPHKLIEVRDNTTQAQSTVPSDGGYTVPQGFFEELTVALKAYSAFSDYYRTIETPTGNPMPFPTNNPIDTEGSIIGENTQLGFTQYTFGDGMMYAWAYTNDVVLASWEIVQDSAFGIQEFVTERCAEAIGRKIAADSANGVGASSKQPVGIYPALTAMGEWSSGDSGGYVTGASSDTLVPMVGNVDGVSEVAGNVLSPQTIQGMVKAVDPAYYDQAAWYVNSSQLVNLRNICDQYGRPLYTSLQGTSPSLEGFPVNLVQAASDVTASTVSGPVFGNLQKAMIKRVARDASLMVLSERYADFRQYGYIMWLRQDHQALDLRAAVTVLPAAS